MPRHEQHHEMVAKGVKLIIDTERSVGGQLGRPSGARFRMGRDGGNGEEDDQ